jgi:DNA-binding NarL/FixJ family response regulator
MAIRVLLLADEDRLIRGILRSYLEAQGFGVAEAWAGDDAGSAAREFRADLVLFHLVASSLETLETTRGIRELSPPTRTVLLTHCADDHFVVEALRSGIRGFVLKSQPASELTRALHEVARGGIYVSPAISDLAIQAWQNKRELARDPLTPRREQVLRLLAEGKTTKEIANQLGLSVKTAEAHRTRLMARLEIHDTAGLVRYAIRRGLVQA